MGGSFKRPQKGIRGRKQTNRSFIAKQKKGCCVFKIATY